MKAIEAVFKLSEILDLPPSIVFEAAREIETIENFYMGKVSEFEVEEDGDDDSTYHEFVPDDVVWEGKKSICDYLGLSVDSTTIYEDDGYEKVYKYKEIN